MRSRRLVESQRLDADAATLRHLSDLQPCGLLAVLSTPVCERLSHSLLRASNRKLPNAGEMINPVAEYRVKG
jgi:hypothetical protein